MMHQQSRCFFKLALVFGLIAGVLGGAWQPARAQTNVNAWSEPVNLSKSGQTVLSFITADSSGAMHAYWLDRLNGIQYSHNGGQGWSKPGKASFPITTGELTATGGRVLLLPRLIGGNRGWIYFFWQNGEGLHYSAANSANGRPITSWSGDILLANSSASYDVLMDANGVIHVVYVQPSDQKGSPAGVYYLRSVNYGSNWSLPVLLYASSYYRNLILETEAPPAENSVDLSLATLDDQKIIFVAFDNQPRKRVFVTRSLDNGVKWEDAFEVDAPLPGAGLTFPGQIHVSARAGQALLAWQVRQSDTVCFTYYRNSDDGGATWNAGQRVYTPFTGCAEQFDFLTQYSQSALLLSSANGLTYLNAWDGRSWAGYQLQSALSSFIDPETQDNVAFAVGGWAMKGGDQLAVIGNDRGAGGDTWFLLRPLDDVSSWFAGEPGWKITPEMELFSGSVSDLQVIGESSETLHAFWVQEEIVPVDTDVLVAVEPRRVVYYASLEDDRWSEPVQILRAPQLAALPGANAHRDDLTDLAVASGPDDRLWAAWKNSTGGEVYFSWARASAASSVAEWADPAVIATIPITATDFSMAVDRGGWIHIAYVVPVNEGRGVYLVQSHDQGKTWSNAVLAFDAQSQKWERVASPSLAAAADGSLWVLFSHQPVGSNALARGLYGIHSPDRGVTWSAPETVSLEHVLWNRMLVQPDLTLHRLWLEQKDGDQALLFHQESTDGGRTWGRVARISDAAGSPGPAAAAIDRAGQIHLAQLLEDSQQRLLLRYWLWNGGAWEVQDDYDLGEGRLDAGKNLVGLGISPLGRLGVVASRSLIGSDAYRWDSLLVGLDRPVTVPAVIATPLPPLPTETGEPQPSPSLPPAVTPTIDLAVLHQGNPSTGGGTMGGLIIALMASLFVIGVGAVVAVIRSRRRNGG